MKSKSDPFCIDWFGGPSAQLEIFSPSANAAAPLYKLKYTPTFRSTIRPPLAELYLGERDLLPINAQLDIVASGTVGSRHGAGGVAVPPPAGTAKALQMAGEQLFDMVIPRYVQSDLRDRGLSLEIGVDEQLLSYPWELLHDGGEYLCLKHNVGRFVNGDRPAIPRFQDPWDKDLEPARVLIISVPRPQWEDGTQFDPLPEAVAETEAIITAISQVPGVEVKLLAGPDATHNKVYEELKSGPFHIVHFNGHAEMNTTIPRQSRLILYDRAMTPANIASYFGKRPPILCFINACETAAMPVWKGQHDIFGIAQAFLETDSYLLGTRWKLNDKVASAFAGVFYRALLVDQKPLGQAIVESRKAAQAALPDDLGWASYIYYGDPRLWFHRHKRERRRKAKPRKKP
jgi:CHAT domain-containing protein